MNTKDRKELQRAIDLIIEAKGIVETIRDFEQDKYDNLSEGLQQTENGMKFEENVSDLDGIYNNLDSAENDLYDIISN